MFFAFPIHTMWPLTHSSSTFSLILYVHVSVSLYTRTYSGFFVCLNSSGQLRGVMAASTSRGRSSSPFHYRKPSSPYSSSSSSSSFMNGRLMPRSCSSSATSFYGSANGHNSRSMTPTRNRSDSEYTRGYGNHTPVHYPSADELLAEPLDASRSGDSISVTIRFRPLR